MKNDTKCKLIFTSFISCNLTFAAADTIDEHALQSSNPFSVSHPLTQEPTILAAEIYGNSGKHDNLTGTVSSDQIYGDSGNDTISGGDGTDDLYGDAGFDSIDGGAQPNGSTGDFCDGGSETDTFVDSPNDIDVTPECEKRFQ